MWVITLSNADYAQVKLHFKDAINEFLNSSYEYFETIETRRVAAIQYFNKDQNLKNFKFDYMKKINNNFEDEVIQEESESAESEKDSQNSYSSNSNNESEDDKKEHSLEKIFKDKFKNEINSWQKNNHVRKENKKMTVKTDTILVVNSRTFSQKKNSLASNFNSSSNIFLHSINIIKADLLK